MQERDRTCERTYPLEAKSDTRIEQAASTEVMPAAVPSIVSPILRKLQVLHQMPSPRKQAAKHKQIDQNKL